MLESTKNQIGQFLSENDLTDKLGSVILYRNSTEEQMIFIFLALAIVTFALITIVD